MLKIHIFFPVNCGDPASPKNGGIMPYEATLVGANITFYCDNGYRPAGSTGVSMCMPTEEWMPSPQCLQCEYT